MHSSMRRCLHAADILKNICVQAYEGGYDADCRATVAALNATCRPFHRVASKVLWSRIFSLRPLIKCMPPDVWFEEEIEDTIDSRSATVALTRPPDSLDWNRFVANASLVTSFKRFGSDPDLDDDTYRTLSLYRPGSAPFLPNLRELVWEESDSDVFEYGYQLLSPKLTTLHIGQPPSDTLVLPIVRSLHVRCPQLRHLFVQCRASIGPVDPVVSRAISQLHHLETIDLTLPLFDDALLHLASLPCLSVAKIFLSRTTGLQERLAAVRSPVFPSLSVLHVSTVRLDPVLASIVDLISSTQLSEVRLCAAHDPSSTVLHDFLAAVARCPSHNTLSAVSLLFPLPSSIPLMRSLHAIPPLDLPECMLDLTTFAPLLSLPELTDLDITSFFLRPDDAFVVHLANACPGLQSLRLAPPYNAGRLSNVTVDGLLSLLRLCPSLSSVTLPINAAIPLPSFPSLIDHTTIPSNENGESQLLTLDVGDSPLNVPDELAAVLSAHCTHPAFEIVAADAHEGDSDPEHVRLRELHGALWDQVARLVRLFAKVRGQERGYWMARARSAQAHAPARSVVHVELKQKQEPDE